MKDSLEKTDLKAENHNSSLISVGVINPRFYGRKIPCIQIFIRSKRGTNLHLKSGTV